MAKKSVLIKTENQLSLPESQVTDEGVYQDRRKLLKQMGFIGAGSLLAGSAKADVFNLFGKDEKAQFATRPLEYKKAVDLDGNKVLTPEQKVITYNNFYEFGTKKSQPSENAQEFKVEPWKLKIGGEVEKPFAMDYDDLYKRFALEERIYRLRCVEAWSMVIPWIGFPLAEIIKHAKPTSKAKYVAFKTLYDPKQMPGTEKPLYRWWYRLPLC